ncbi:MAG TPA: heme-binding protein [Candidatus Limnocylindrales bacterium]|nr:heme-binding protein [Candidatus Limnocylindrales bacterium]
MRASGLAASVHRNARKAASTAAGDSCRRRAEPGRGAAAPLAIVTAWLAASLAACGSGGSSSTGTPQSCDGSCAQRALTAADVEGALARAVGEAERLGVSATIAVVDRIGNVLAVFAMDGAAGNTVITSGRDVRTGLETLVVPAAAAAISKAGTAAYLSSQGNAFTSRTAGQIVQEHFNPGESGRPGGPLFGVQFSQLPCGDLVRPFDADQPDDRAGPHPMPLGLSADPGSMPLYLDSTGPGGMSGRVAAGGIGVEIGCSALACGAFTAAPGSEAATLLEALAGPGHPTCESFAACTDDFATLYSFDPHILDIDESVEERIAAAGAAGLEAPEDRRAERIFVDGKSLRFADEEEHGPPSDDGCEVLEGSFLAVAGFTDVASCAGIRGGIALGTSASGVLSVPSFGDSGLPAEILVTAGGVPRFPPRAGTAPAGEQLTALEVRTVLEHALSVADSLRAAIRRPLDTPARVSISVVDSEGVLLGLVRSPDAPVFGIDVSLQKARAAVLASSPQTRARLEAAPHAIQRYLDATIDFLTERAVFGDEEVTADMVFTGDIAFAARSIGNLARPFFPDGIDRRDNGPLSRPLEQWSPFSTGFQLDLVIEGIACSAAGIRGVAPCSTDLQPAPSCSPVAGVNNGIQIFPGAVPIYRGTTLVGAVGISGDGIDQDDAIAFLGLHNASVELGSIHNAPQEMRADRLEVNGSNVRYVSCPVRPFRNSDEQSPCDGR